ncbi:MAG TPA: serine hydrolase domain-containing protein, partial [Candidatus Baltobacteraceae bacterium]
MAATNVRLMRTGIAALVVLLLAAPLSARAQQPFAAAKAHAVDAAVRAEIHSGSTPGLAVGIVEDGLLVYARGFGYANAQTKRRTGPSTQFFAGSLGRQFTAACVLLLAQQKKLSLDDSVTKYIPELTIAKNVTLRELLLQTSGLPAVRTAQGIPHDLTRPIAVEALVKAANQMGLKTPPGTAYDDSNFNYMLAGLVVQRVSGVPLSIFYSTQIFQPL